MLVKTSIVCFIMILYMVGFYYRKPHIPTKSTRIFQALTIVALLNTMFDLITIYTVNHRDRIHEGVNLIAHIIYLMSILGFVYLLFIYLRSFLERNHTFSAATRICQNIPFAGSSLGILVLPITYVHGRTTDYSRKRINFTGDSGASDADFNGNGSLYIWFAVCQFFGAMSMGRYDIRRQRQPRPMYRNVPGFVQMRG